MNDPTMRLQRIADGIPCSNKFPCYYQFDTDPKRLHLYKQYPSVRGRTLFQTKDRLLLTDSIISHFLDMDALKVAIPDFPDPG